MREKDEEVNDEILKRFLLTRFSMKLNNEICETKNFHARNLDSR